MSNAAEMLLDRAAARPGLDIERRQADSRDIPEFIKQNKSVLFESAEDW